MFVASELYFLIIDKCVRLIKLGIRLPLIFHWLLVKRLNDECDLQQGALIQSEWY